MTSPRRPICNCVCVCVCVCVRVTVRAGVRSRDKFNPDAGKIYICLKGEETTPVVEWGGMELPPSWNGTASKLGSLNGTASELTQLGGSSIPPHSTVGVGEVYDAWRLFLP